MFNYSIPEQYSYLTLKLHVNFWKPIWTLSIQFLKIFSCSIQESLAFCHIKKTFGMWQCFWNVRTHLLLLFFCVIDNVTLSILTNPWQHKLVAVLELFLWFPFKAPVQFSKLSMFTFLMLEQQSHCFWQPFQKNSPKKTCRV